MSLIVQKYGGTSVGTLDRIRDVAQHVKTSLETHEKIVVVVSAMGKQTNELKSMAFDLAAAPKKRELDMLLTVGERVSMALLSIALGNLGLESVSLTGSQCGILTDATHGNARIQAVLGDRIRAGLKTHNLVIVAGFQGVHQASKEITTLGRGGSDLTAVALAHTLAASRCQIYSDVDGVCTADPRLVPTARVMPELTWQQATRLAWSGARVLHPRAAHLALKYGIALELRSSFNFGTPGTTVSETASMESGQLLSIAHQNNVSLMSFEAAEPTTLLAQALKWLWQQGQAPLLNQLSHDHDRGQVTLVVPEDLTEGLSKALAAQTKELSTLNDMSTVAILGQGLAHNPELVERVVTTFATSAKVHAMSTGDEQILVCLPTADCDAIVQQLHATFIEAEA